MTVTAIETQGTKFEIRTTDSPAVFTEIKSVTNFSLFDGKANIIDITNLQSTAKEKLMGLQDFGGVSLTINHLPTDTGQVACRTAKGNRTLQTFKVTFSDLSTATFTGYVLANPINGGVDSKTGASIDIEVSGSPTFA